MHEPHGSAVLVTVAWFAFAACGGGDPVQGPTESGESPLLSFEQIAGAWAGWGVEPRGEGESDDIWFWIRANFSSSARQGSVIGTIQYGGVNSAADTPAFCEGNWIAEDADDPVFRVVERITSGDCPDGRVVLTLNPETAELSYDFAPDGGQTFLEAEGTLVRGSDPGPRP